MTHAKKRQPYLFLFIFFASVGAISAFAEWLFLMQVCSIVEVFGVNVLGLETDVHICERRLKGFRYGFGPFHWFFQRIYYFRRLRYWLFHRPYERDCRRLYQICVVRYSAWDDARKPLMIGLAIPYGREFITYAPVSAEASEIVWIYMIQILRRIVRWIFVFDEGA